MSWRSLALWTGLVLALVVANLGIAGRETLVREGETVLLELAPVDPRSLIQGDYMALNFAIAADIRTALGESVLSHGYMDGYAILARNDDGTTHYLRTQTQPAPTADNEIALRYRLRGGELRIVTNAWFFPEGQAERYQPARYGELRVGKDGEALLIAMRDNERNPL